MNRIFRGSQRADCMRGIFVLFAFVALSVAARAMDVVVRNGQSHDCIVYYQVSFEDVDPSHQNTYAMLTVRDPSGRVVQQTTLDTGAGSSIDDRQDYAMTFSVGGSGDGTYTVDVRDGISDGWGMTSSGYDLQDNSPTSPPAAPTVTLEVEPNTISSRGGQVSIQWASTDADTVINTSGFSASSVNGTTYDTIGANGSFDDTFTYTYSITVSGPGGAVSASAHVYQDHGYRTPISFLFPATDFIYNEQFQGPDILTDHVGATYAVSGTPSATDVNTYTFHVEGTGDFYGSADCTWTIHPKPVAFRFSNLSQEYDGGTKSASVEPDDPDATYTSSLSGGPEPGIYGVSATAYGNYTGSGSDTLQIGPKPVAFYFSDLSYTYDGRMHSATVRCSDPSATFDSGLDGGPDAGDYGVWARATGNYSGEGSATLTIDRKSVDFSFSDLSYTYDGNTHSASVAANDPNATYDSDLTKGPEPGSYTVWATANGNYTGSGSDTLTISQPISTSFSFSPASVVYDHQAHTLTVTASPSDASYNTGGTTSATNVGKYSATAEAYGSYSGSDTWNWEITPKPVTFAFGNLSPTYDGKAHAVMVTPSDGLTTYAVTYTGTSGTVYATSTNAPTGAGNYTVSAVASGNYTGTVTAVLTIGQAPLTVTANNQTSSYGAGLPTLTYSISGFVNGETASVVSGSAIVATTATTVSPVGTYAIVPAVGSLSAANYRFSTLVNGTLTVSKASLTVTANSKSRAYGAANPAFDATYTGFVNGDTATVISGAPGFSTPATTGSTVGTYAITPGVGTLSAANYAFGPFVAGTLTITKATLTATADNQTRVYGAANPPFTIGYTGFVNGDTAGSISPPSASTIASESSAVGSYPIVLSGGSAANYTLSLVNGTLAITKAPLAVAADNQSRTYGAANPTLTHTFSGFRNGDTPAVVSGTAALTTSATPASPVGSYAIVAAAGSLSATNYTFGPFSNAILTVGKALLTVTADNQTRPYAAPNPALTVSYSGFVNGDTAAVLTTPATATTTATVASPVGAYAIVPSGAAAANYTYNYVTGVLTVAKANAPVVLGNLSQVWDGAVEPATATTTPTGLVVNLTYNGSATVPQAAGSYPVVGTINDPNYQGSATGTLVIAKATPVITWTTPAPITYPAPLGPTQLNATANVPGTFAYSPSSGAVLGAGTRTLTATFTPTDAGNYNSATASVGLVVNKATPVITWSAPAPVVYGTALNATQLDAMASVPGTFVYAPNAGTILGAGAQTLGTTFTPTDSANYNGASAAISLVVNKAPLVATADDQSKAYGAANPTLTIRYNGFVNGDSVNSIAAPVASTSATTSSGVGTYPITVTGGSAANYTLTLGGGNLHITPAVLMVVADNQSRAYRAPNPTLTTHFTGFVNGDGSSAVTGLPAVSTTATDTSAVGTYPIVPTLGTLSAVNYQFAFVNGTLTVVPKAVTFMFGNLAYVYDSTLKTATVVASDPDATFTADLTKGPDAATYAVTAAATGNYSGSGTANLVISPAPQTIALSPGDLTVFAGETRTFSATGGHNAYVWSGNAGASGSANTVTLTFAAVGTYTASVFNAASQNYQQSNAVAATIQVVSNHQVSSLTPLESSLTITDPASPMAGQTYRRIWSEGGWTAYLGRDGVRFEVKGQAWPSVKSVELQSRAPGGEWTQLAVQTPTDSSTTADAVFSVMLGTTAPGQPLVPASFAAGNPLTGTWSFRARVQDSSGVWSDFSPEVPVQVVLPITTRTVLGQTVPPAGPLGDWFTASPMQAFSVPLWIP